MTTRTYRAEAFLNAAARLGLTVTVGTEREQTLAHHTPGAGLTIDDWAGDRAREQIVEFAHRFPLDAVVGVDDDTIVLAARASAVLGLPHNSVESVQASRYKDVMRVALAESDVLSPRFEVIGIDDDPAVAATRQAYPVVLKPLALSASRGVIRADDDRQFVAAFREVSAILAEAGLEPGDAGSRQVLVEAFIPGAEVALEGLLDDGRLTVLALFDKPDPLDGPYFEESIYLTPSRLPDATQQAIADTVIRAARALGLRHGPLHAELRLNDRGAWIVEVAARSIGGQCSRSLRFDHDLSLEEIILRQAARLPIPNLVRERCASGVMMIPVPRAGVLRAVGGLDQARAVPGIDDLTITIARGQPVIPLPRGASYLGFIFARADTPAAVERSLREAHRQLEFEIE